MLRVWQVLSRLLGGVAGLPAAARTQRTEALLAGARSYLEDNFTAHMQKVVATHRTQVRARGAGWGRHVGEARGTVLDMRSAR